MDCAVEESDIRRALDNVAGIVSLNFQLGARTVAIGAPADVVPRAVEAIRAAGYEPGSAPWLTRDRAVWRTVLGVLFLAMITNAFTLLEINPFYEGIVQGVLIVAAIAFDALSRRGSR